MENKNIVDPEEVRRSAQRTTSLVFGIGNAHGYYKGGAGYSSGSYGSSSAKLSIFHWFWHGCTGMKEEIIKEAIKLGVAKINFGTEIRYKYVEHYEEGLKTMNHQGHSWKLSQYANEKLQEKM